MLSPFARLKVIYKLSSNPALSNQNDPCRHHIEKYGIKQQFSQYFDYETVSGKPSCRHISMACRHMWRIATVLDNTDLIRLLLQGSHDSQFEGLTNMFFLTFSR